MGVGRWGRYVGAGNWSEGLIGGDAGNEGRWGCLQFEQGKGTVEKISDLFCFPPPRLISIIFYDPQVRGLFSYIVTCYITTYNL